MEREKRQKQRRRKEGREMETEEGRNNGDTETVVRCRVEEERWIEKRNLKVRMRTPWSSELDRNTAAVTSVLISPSAG